MVIKIDFQSEEALYMQLRNQIILGIATSVIQEGDSLPSVRHLAGDIGINMHTVNKAYSLLRQEGFLTIDRRKGAVIALDVDKMEAINEIKKNLRVILAKAHCKNISADEVHELVDEIFYSHNSINIRNPHIYCVNSYFLMFSGSQVQMSYLASKNDLLTLASSSL